MLSISLYYLSKGTKKRANKQSLFKASAKYLLDYYHKGTKKRANKQSFQFTTNKKVLLQKVVKVLLRSCLESKQFLIRRYGKGLFCPPTLAVVKYDALTALTLALLEERYLITHAKLYILTDVKMSLSRCLQIEIIPNTGLQAETDVMEGLIIARAIVLVEQRTLTITIDGVIAIVIVARGIEEVYTPVNNTCDQPKSELIVQSDTCTNFV